MTKHGDDMHISEGELSAMTRDLDEIHHATLPAMHEAVAEWNEVHHGEHSRRMFLLGGGAAVSALVLAACSSSTKTQTTPTTATPRGGGLSGDLAVAALAASLENLAVNTYRTALDAATA